jgi:hypothetical protein
MNPQPKKVKPVNVPPLSRDETATEMLLAYAVDKFSADLLRAASFRYGTILTHGGGVVDPIEHFPQN